MRGTDTLPSFMLMATDEIAPMALRFYAGQVHVKKCGPGQHRTEECPCATVQRALTVADRMERWPERRLPP